MQWIDYALLGIILISTVVSAFRGLIKEILSMLAWAVAFFVAMKFYKPLTQFITFTDDQSIRVVIALFGLFIGTLMIIGFVNYIITLVIKKTGLSGTDHQYRQGHGRFQLWQGGYPKKGDVQEKAFRAGEALQRFHRRLRQKRL